MSLQESNTLKEEGAERQKLYKNAGKHEDMRRRRTECSVEIRKQKRGEAMMKRRNVNIDNFESDEESQGETQLEQQPKPNLSLKEIFACLCANPDFPKLRIAFESLRRALSKDKNPPINEVINMNLVEAMVRGLSVQDTKVQFEAAWGLTNVVSGTSDQTRHAIEKGCIPPLLELCVSSDLKLAEQAAWALANITGDNPQFRDLVVKHNCLHAIQHLTDNVGKLSIEFVRTLAWWYSNLCRHKNPRLPIEVLRCLAPGIATLIQHPDEVVQQDTCWALSYLTDGPDSTMMAARDVGVIPLVVNYLAAAMVKGQCSGIAPAIRVLGNFTSGADELTQTIVDSGCLEKLVPQLLTMNNNNIQKETSWLVSNIFAGTKAQIQVALNAGLLPLIMKIFAKNEAKSQEEAHWAIFNLSQGGTHQQVVKIIENDGLELIVDGLNHTSKTDMIRNMLEALSSILRVTQELMADRFEIVLDAFESTGVLEYIEGCQHHNSMDIYELAYAIVDTYFKGEEEEEYFEQDNKENNVVPPNGGFQF